MAMKRTIDFHLNDQRKKAKLYRAIKNDLDNNDTSSDEEPINSCAVLYPLSHYANDPEQLVCQLFSVIRGKRLARLRPSELKDVPLEELKADCLIELLSMSKKRVLATLEAREMDSSSDSDDSVDNQRKQKFKAERKEEIAQKRAHKEKKTKSSKKKKVETESESECEKSEEKEGKTLLEILELEMKAKAIRALLAPNEKDNNTQIEEAIKNEIVSEKTNENNIEIKSWNERYEEREDVKDVVKTSKLCTNMRRRMLLYQQKMLADRAKLKAEEAKNLKSGVSIKSKVEETLYYKTGEGQSNTNELKEKLNDAVDEKTVQNTGHNIQEMIKIHEDGIKKHDNDIGSNNYITPDNVQESVDDDSEKSTDFERVLSEYSQKNTDLELIINEYSQKNTDLEEEINKCTKNNDDMENTMNMCAQKNSDIELAFNDFSVKNHSVDKNIIGDNEKMSDSETIEKYSKNITDLDSLISKNLKKNNDLKAIVNEYSNRNSSFVTLMGEYSQNNVNIQSVIGDYAEGNHKLESIIDEYSNRNAQLKTMIDEYSVNNCNVEKIIDQNNQKHSLIEKFKMESAAEKVGETENIINKNTNIKSVSKTLDNETDSTPVDKEKK